MVKGRQLVEVLLALSTIPHSPYLLGRARIIGDNNTPIATATQVLGWIEAEGSNVP
jgi:hypothetical protein